MAASIQRRPVARCAGYVSGFSPRQTPGNLPKRRNNCRMPMGTRPGAWRFCRTNPHRGRNVPLSSLRRGGFEKPTFPTHRQSGAPAEWIKWIFQGGRGRRRKALPHPPLLMSQLRNYRCGSAAQFTPCRKLFRWRCCTGLTIFVTVSMSISRRKGCSRSTISTICKI